MRLAPYVVFGDQLDQPIVKGLVLLEWVVLVVFGVDPHDGFGLLFSRRTDAGLRPASEVLCLLPRIGKERFLPGSKW